MGMRVVISTLLLAGCVSIPATPSSDPPKQPPLVNGASPTSCDYTEQYDATNDYLASSGYQLEETGIAFGSHTTRICGQIDIAHFNTTSFSIDVDNYGFTLIDDADVMVTLSGSAMATISSVGTWAYDPSAHTTVGGGYFVNDHGAFSAHLAAGSYEISVEAYDNQDATAAVPYAIQIAVDQPLVRCPRNTGVADYVEANDGANSHGNDVIDVDFASWPYRSLTPSNADAPESMGLGIARNTSYRISGTAAMSGRVGSYLDHDTYAIATDAATNQLSVRLDWPGANADLDYYLSAEGSTFPLASAATVQMGGSEFATFAVAPNTWYWLWVGAASTSTGAAGYDATICGETVLP